MCGRQDLFHLLGPHRPDFRWLIVGARRSGSTFHIDPNATCAWVRWRNVAPCRRRPPPLPPDPFLFVRSRASVDPSFARLHCAGWLMRTGYVQNTTITGAKKWVMYPPDCVPPGVVRVE